MSTIEVILLVAAAVGAVLWRYRTQPRSALARLVEAAPHPRSEFEIVSRSTPSPAPSAPQPTNNAKKVFQFVGTSDFQVKETNLNLEARCLRTGRVVRVCQCPAHRKLK